LLGQRLRALGPYALLEIVLPGGTLFALALYAYRRWTGTVADIPAAQPVVEACAAALFIAMVAFGRFCAAKPPTRASTGHAASTLSLHRAVSSVRAGSEDPRKGAQQ
jgi:hypothetical protein